LNIASQVWLDARGYTRITLIRTSTGVGSLLSPLQAISNAGLLECWEGPQSLYTPAPVAAQYESGQQTARLTFVCADGTQAVLQVFAPVLGIFQTDEVTVDSANANVVTLIAAAVGNLMSSSGSLATAYVSGSMGPRPQSAG
jgi:hypothetical protein